MALKWLFGKDDRFYDDELGWRRPDGKYFVEHLYAHRAIWLQSKTFGFHDLGRDVVEEVLELIDHNLPPNVLDWGFNDGNIWWFKFKHVWVRFHPSTQARTFLQPEIITSAVGLTFSSTQHIKREVETAVNHNGPSMMNFRDVAVLIMQVVDIVSMASEGLINDTLGWRFRTNTLQNWDHRKSNRFGLAAGSVKNTEQSYLGLTPAQIYSMIPSHFRILAFESVRSESLTAKWVKFQEHLRQVASGEDVDKLRKKFHPDHGLGDLKSKRLTKDQMINEMVRPHVTFHGTKRTIVPSIVEHGFLMPGSVVNGQLVSSPRSNAFKRRGIYSSQSPQFALSFSECHGIKRTTPQELPGLRLFVCATLMGRTYVGPNVHHDLREGYDAHFNGNYEYIVHDPRAMLPCYVIHLDFGAPQAIKNVSRFLSKRGFSGNHHYSFTTPQPKVVLSPGDIQRQQAAKKAAALKWFPYGYGPSTGTQFKILEIAPRDEDEEPHGKVWYQALLHQYGHLYGQILTWMDVLKEDEGLLARMFREPVANTDDDGAKQQNS